MTVAELRKILSHYADDALVMIELEGKSVDVLDVGVQLSGAEDGGYTLAGVVMVPKVSNP